MRENIEQIRFSFPQNNGKQIISKEAKHFIQQFLIEDPKQRMQLKQIPNHPFILRQSQYLSKFKFFGIELAFNGQQNTECNTNSQRADGESNGIRMVSRTEQIEEELRSLRFAQNYINRAMKLQQKHYGDDFQMDRIIEIIEKLQEKDALRNNQSQRSKTPNPVSSQIKTKRIYVPKKRSLTPNPQSAKRAKHDADGSNPRHRDVSIVVLE